MNILEFIVIIYHTLHPRYMYGFSSQICILRINIATSYTKRIFCLISNYGINMYERGCSHGHFLTGMIRNGKWSKGQSK